jgi:ABC-2 type transport system permease protein
MFLSIAAYELRYRFRCVSTYIYFAIFLILSWGLVSLAGGVFAGVNVNVGRGGDFNHLNSPTSLLNLFAGIMFFGVLVIASIFGSSAARDFETEAFALYFTKPISKTSYVLGRFIGSLATVLLIFAGIAIGIFIATLMPYMQPMYLGPNHILAYLQPYLVYALPNLVFMGLIFFGGTLYTRRVMTAYTAATVLFLGYMLASVLMGDVVDNRYACLLDPFGSHALSFDIRYWSAEEYNTRFISLNGMLALDRLVWLIAGLAGWMFLIRKFNLSWEAPGFFHGKLQKKSGKTMEPAVIPSCEAPKNLHLKPYDTWRQTLTLTRTEIRAVRTSPAFWVIAAVFVLFLVASVSQVGRMFGTSTYPLTSKMLMVLETNLFIFGMIISVFYAGDLLWRKRTIRMDQLIDVTPHTNLAGYLSKLCTVIWMQLVILSLILLTGIGAQFAMKFFHPELGLYLFQLLAVAFPTMLIYTLAAFVFAIIMPNKYAGYGGMILFYLLFWMAPEINIDHNLAIFNTPFNATYSEMNGYGHFLTRFYVLKAYWGLFAIMMTMIALKFWPRGVETGFRQRWRRIRSEGYDRMWKWTTGVGAAFLALGGFIFYNTNIVNTYHTSRYWEKGQVRYEKQFKHFEKVVQPRITAADVRVELYPSKRRMTASGSYWLVNRGAAPIDTLVIDCNIDAKPSVLDFGRPATMIGEGKESGLRVYLLSEPIAPGDSLQMRFEIAYRGKLITNGNPGSDFVRNGTFMHSNYFPQLGYNPDMEISDTARRKKYHLPEKPRMPRLEDMSARMNNYVSSDADWIRFHAIVGTDGDQVAFAPGDLIRSWREKGRYYAEFGCPTPILNFTAFVSGKYVVAKAAWNGIGIEIYHDPKHDYNTKAMLEAAQSTLRYCSENFRPYPFKTLRIVEVPYVYYAQSFPTIIPFSENLGFVAQVYPEDPKDVDYPVYVTSHEISHQWWAHVVVGANVQGSTLFSEALAQYTALMIMKQKYGRDRMRRFLTYEDDSYLSGRAGEEKEEQPLYRNENQQYIHYNKGSLAMFGLQDDIGATNVNRALSAFVNDHAYQNPPYPVSTDLLDCLRPEIPDSLEYLMDDLFTNITLYDNRVETVKSVKAPDGKCYLTTVEFSTNKLRCDGKGAETSVPMQGKLEIAVYGKINEHPLGSTIVPVSGGKASVTLTSVQKPDKVVLDPMFKLIDKRPLDNTKEIR